MYVGAVELLIGLELSLARLWSLRRYVAGIGGLQFALSALAIGGGLAALGVPGSGAIVLGLGLAMSSTAIVMQLLEEQGRSTTTVGRVALAVLLFQDLMVAPVLFGVQFLAHDERHVAVSLAGALLQAALAVVAIVAAGRYVLQPIVRFAAQSGNRDLILAITLFMVVGVAAATGVAGLSTALGAFLVGLLLVLAGFFIGVAQWFPLSAEALVIAPTQAAPPPPQIAAFEYFPDQYVNQATRVEPHIEAF